MKIYLIRCLCLLVVLCFTVCLMANFVFASDDTSVSPIYFSCSFFPNDDVFVSFYELSFDDSISLALLMGDLDNSLYFTVPSLGVDGYLQGSFVDDGDLRGFLFQLSDDPLCVCLGELSNFVFDDEPGSDDYITLVFVSDRDLGSISGYIYSEHYFPEPSGADALLSDLQLTGESFLDTVEGIVVTIGKTPLLLLTVGIFFAGGCIGIFGRFLSKD